MRCSEHHTNTQGDIMETKNTMKAELASEKLNRAQAAMGHNQISDNDDPRIQLTAAVNRQMAALTPAEREALLNKWGY